MDMRARLVVEGFMAGLHKSPYHGFSVEFAEHRQYMPGDEIKHIDWKVYGKTNRYYVKQFEEETNLKAHILLDCSGSMGYSSHEITKLQYATWLAAAFSYLMIRQRDAIGLVSFDARIRRMIPPKSVATYLPLMLHELDALRPANTTNIAQTLHLVAEKIQRRGLIILFSDLFDSDPAALIQSLKHFRHRNHEVIVFQIMDPLEESFGFTEDAVFEDMETGTRLGTQPWHIKDEYRKMMQEFLGKLRKACRENRIDYVPLNTTTSYGLALSRYLQKRRKIGG